MPDPDHRPQKKHDRCSSQQSHLWCYVCGALRETCQAAQLCPGLGSKVGLCLVKPQSRVPLNGGTSHAAVSPDLRQTLRYALQSFKIGPRRGFDDRLRLSEEVRCLFLDNGAGLSGQTPSHSQRLCPDSVAESLLDEGKLRINYLNWREVTVVSVCVAILCCGLI